MKSPLSFWLQISRTTVQIHEILRSLSSSWTPSGLREKKSSKKLVKKSRKLWKICSFAEGKINSATQAFAWWLAMKTYNPIILSQAKRSRVTMAMLGNRIWEENRHAEIRRWKYTIVIHRFVNEKRYKYETTCWCCCFTLHGYRIATQRITTRI